MKKISYSKDVDILSIELSHEPIAYAEDEGNIVLHYSPNAKLVLVETLDLRQLIKTNYHGCEVRSLLLFG